MPTAFDYPNDHPSHGLRSHLLLCLPDDLICTFTLEETADEWTQLAQRPCMPYLTSA